MFWTLSIPERMDFYAVQGETERRERENDINMFYMNDAQKGIQTTQDIVRMSPWGTCMAHVNRGWLGAWNISTNHKLEGKSIMSECLSKVLGPNELPEHLQGSLVEVNSLVDTAYD